MGKQNPPRMKTADRLLAFIVATLVVVICLGLVGMAVALAPANKCVEMIPGGCP